MINKLYIFVLILLIGSAGYLFSQNEEMQKLNYAKSFEQAGDFETAARMFKELFDSKPNNQIYFDGVVRTFKALNKFSELLPIVQPSLEKHKTVYNYILYAELLWRTGSNEKADENWKYAIELQPEKQETYSDIALSQVELQQYEKAIKTLEDGRKTLDKNRIFADELCRLYIAFGNYKRGTEEAINILEETKNIALAQGRISALLTSPEAKVHVQKVLEDKASSNNNNIIYLKVYAWFLRAIAEYDKAFQVYKDIDKLTNGNGREILSFANDSRTDGQFDVALKAFEYIISLGKDSKFLSSALYGYPRTLEQKLLINSKLTPESAKAIIKNYREIIAQFPDNPASADAMFRISLIYLDHLGDNESAKLEINNILIKHPKSNSAPEALNLLGRIFIMEDELTKASETFQKVLKEYNKSNQAGLLIAQYNLAEIEFFRGNIDSAQSLYKELLSQSDNDVANDALEKIVLIEQNKGLIQALSSYSKARYFLKQKKYNQAIVLFNETSKSAAGTGLAEKSFIDISLIYFELAKYDSSLVTIKTLIETYPNSIYKDKVLLLGGDCNLQLNNKDKAIESYNNLIIEFPRSIYVQEARDKLRFLRDNKNL